MRTKFTDDEQSRTLVRMRLPIKVGLTVIQPSFTINWKGSGSLLAAIPPFFTRIIANNGLIVKVSGLESLSQNWWVNLEKKQKTELSVNREGLAHTRASDHQGI